MNEKIKREKKRKELKWLLKYKFKIDRLAMNKEVVTMMIK
jgi:hypothetical protein